MYQDLDKNKKYNYRYCYFYIRVIILCIIISIIYIISAVIKINTNSNYKYSGLSLLPPKYIGINKIITQAQFEYMQSNSTFNVVYGDFDTADIHRTESNALTFDNQITLWALDTNKTYRYPFTTIINDTTYVSDLGKVKTLIAPYTLT